ncbi:ATP-binding protein [uncultured Sphaerotilus sp.]|uniref:ATP-binding protein n=1 Tax=uncultured Sphaerotilus sp. TaxID=474984 RepID=UPI0030CA1714
MPAALIPRTAAATATRLARGFPIVAITGPRQSGKTTLARAVFPDKPYVSLEDPDEREFATADPRRFLARFDAHGAVLDEIQRCPALFSYLQGLVDTRQRMGDFVLTGSQQPGLVSGLTQSLAGRVGLVQLLPFSMGELEAAGRLPSSLDEVLWRGLYPPLHHRDLTPGDWLANYVATYVERDVRQMLAVRDLSLFQRFLRLCAARSGQLLNLSALAGDCGITHVTAREWLTVLEASYLVMLLRPYHRNFGKRLVKTPKLYLLDPGLMAWLLGIRSTETLGTHAQRGALFETLIVTECVKHAFHRGEAADLYFWRDGAGLEVDLLRERDGHLQAMELKSGATFASDWLGPLRRWQALADTPTEMPWLVYGGAHSAERQGVQAIAWRDLPKRL